MANDQLRRQPVRDLHICTSSHDYERMRKRFIEAEKNRRCITDGMTVKFINKGLPIPEGWKPASTNPEGNANKICITNGKRNKFIRSFADMPKTGGWKIGSCNLGNTDFFWMTDGKIDKQVPAGTAIPGGWRKGRHKSPTKGYI